MPLFWRKFMRRKCSEECFGLRNIQMVLKKQQCIPWKIQKRYFLIYYAIFVFQLFLAKKVRSRDNPNAETMLVSEENVRGRGVQYCKERKNGMESVESQKVFLKNEMEANQYAAKCLVMCTMVCAGAWVLTLLRIFTMPVVIMSTAMPVIILCFLTPTLLCRITGGDRKWMKYAVVFCAIMGVFILSSAMPKHGVLVWTLPLMLSCHYYSKKFTRITLVVSQILFSCSIYIGMYFGEWDQILLDSAYYSGPRVVTGKLLYDATVFFVFTRAAALWGLSSICTTLAKRTRRLLVRQAKDSEERQRIETELDVANRIQADMLPCIFPAFPERPEFDIYASMSPAKEVGGDFYDFFMVDERHLAIVIGDVSGKGVPAALFMVIAKTLIKDHTKPNVSLGNVFTEVNRLLCDSNNEGLFVTAFEGVLDLATGEFCYVNAGHEIPFISRAGEPYESYRIPSGFVLAGMEDMKYHGGCLRLAPGDKIFQYTDGVTEAANRKNELFGMERLKRTLEKNRDKKPEQLVNAVRKDIDVYAEGTPQFDDITMICVEYVKEMDVRKERLMMENAKMRTFYADEIIMREGETYDEMYKIVYGSVAVYIRYGEKDEHLIGIYSKSKCFGEMNVLSDQPSIYTVVAYDEVLLMHIGRDSLEEFIRNNPRNAIDIMSNMVSTYTMMQKNIGLLLDDIYEKQDENKKRTEEIKRKIMQYSVSGLNI